MRVFGPNLVRLLALVFAVVQLSLPMDGAERQASRKGLRDLAAELAERFGPDGVELRTKEGAVAIERERFGSRLGKRPPLFTSDIPPQEVLRAMNREREARGLKPLVIDERLSLAAADRIEDMMKLDYFAHVSPDGRKPFASILARGYDFRHAGENLAAGFSSGASVVAAWMHSPGHRANILSTGYEEVGIAVCSEPPKEGMSGHLVVALYAAE